MEKKFIIDHLLRPHWKALAVAFVAVIVDGMADLFGPWPIKIVLDYVVGSHPLHRARRVDSCARHTRP